MKIISVCTIVAFLASTVAEPAFADNAAIGAVSTTRLKTAGTPAKGAPKVAPPVKGNPTNGIGGTGGGRFLNKGQPAKRLPVAPRANSIDDYKIGGTARIPRASTPGLGGAGGVGGSGGQNKLLLPAVQKVR